MIERTKWLALGVALFLGAWVGTGSVSAQGFGGNNPSGFAPGTGGGRGMNNQTLSPYLNLLRGGSNAVNYFYGVRGANQPQYMGMFGQQQGFGPRQTFFPYVDTLADLADNALPTGKIAPTGHPVGFSNTLNYFPGMGQPRGQQSQVPLGRGRR